MYDPCSFCPKGKYSQPCCSAQCVYGKDLDELKMLREQTKKLAEVFVCHGCSDQAQGICTARDGK